MSIYFVTGIDTGVGKSVATGLMARYLLSRGRTVTTGKIVQTGSGGEDDIVRHRRLMGVAPGIHDEEGTTCPYRFAYPASPHLAARREGREVDLSVLAAAAEELSARYDRVLIEGAGGLAVPLNGSFTILDYLERVRYPVIVVSSPRIGSINHTLLTLEALKSRGLEVPGIVYNLFHREAPEIVDDSRRLFRRCLAGLSFGDAVVDMPAAAGSAPLVDFSPLFPEE